MSGRLIRPPVGHWWVMTRGPTTRTGSGPHPWVRRLTTSEVPLWERVIAVWIRPLLPVVR